VWALAEAGATSAEIPVVGEIHLRLDDAAVELPGSAHLDARTARLTDWGIQHLKRRLADLKRDGRLDSPLAYSGDGPEESQQASAATALRDILTRAGLSDDTVAIISIRAWLGAKVFADGTDRRGDPPARSALVGPDRRVDRIRLAERMKPSDPASDWEKVDALIDYDALHACAAAFPGRPSPEIGSRRRLYPPWYIIFFCALVTVFKSARHADTELARPGAWEHVRERYAQRYPSEPPLPDQPIRRHHWQYAKNLVGPNAWESIRSVFESTAADTARQLGLFDPEGPGSWTHPDLNRIMYGDSKCVTPLFKAKPGDTKVDPITGQIRTLRADPDASNHTTGSGTVVHGIKVAFLMGRTDYVHGRVMLAFEHDGDHNEMKTTMGS